MKMIIYEDGQVYEIDCVIYEPFPEAVENGSDEEGETL